MESVKILKSEHKNYSFPLKLWKLINNSDENTGVKVLIDSDALTAYLTCSSIFGNQRFGHILGQLYQYGFVRLARPLKSQTQHMDFLEYIRAISDQPDILEYRN